MYSEICCALWVFSLIFTVVYREEQGFRLISEQVSHHPPVSAFHAESLAGDFVFHGSIYPKLKFWGKSIEAEPKGTITLELPKWVHSFDFFVKSSDVAEVVKLASLSVQI